MYKKIFEKIKFAYRIDESKIIEKLNISKEQYQKILETAEASDLPYDLLLKIKNIFKVSLDYLISGIPTQEDEKILNKSLNKSMEQELIAPAIQKIKKQIFSDGFGEYWRNDIFYFDYNLYINSSGNQYISANPVVIFDENLNFWDFFKKNNFPIIDLKLVKNTGNTARAIEVYDYYFPNQKISWENLEIVFAKYGIANYLKRNNPSTNSVTKYMNPEWINRCFNILKGEKLEPKKIIKDNKNIEISIGAVEYSNELTRWISTNTDSSTWDYEQIDKILKIGGVVLEEKKVQIGNLMNSEVDKTIWEPSNTITEYVKALVVKNLNKSNLKQFDTNHVSIGGGIGRSSSRRFFTNNLKTFQKENNNSFLFYVEEAKNTDEGIMVNGTIKKWYGGNSPCQDYEEVEIIGIKPTKKTSIVGVQILEKMPGELKDGNNAVIFLGDTDDLSIDDIVKGQVIVTPGTLSAHTEFRANIFLKVENNVDVSASYKTGDVLHFWFNSIEIIGKITVEHPIKPSCIASYTSIIVKLETPIAMEEGTKFSIFEGDEVKKSIENYKMDQQFYNLDNKLFDNSNYKNVKLVGSGTVVKVIK